MSTFKIGEEVYSANDLVKMGASSPDLFYRLFFPKTVRQGSAPFHLAMDATLEDPSKRLVQFQMFRGSAKTTRLRMYTARRIAYGLTRTALYVGASEGHAARSIKWIRRQIEVNKTFAGVFSLQPGSKWQETELEIINSATGENCWLLGAGITGNIRGINFDDYRPDLIVLDDVLTDENAATKDQREKVIDLILGALKGSLTPATEDPNAKMVMAQTPMHPEDASEEARKDPTWTTIQIPIWTKETLDAPVSQQESVWPERYPSESVRDDKRAAAALNRLSIWVRENEVRLITAEQRAFKNNWLQTADIMPVHTMNVLAIDPLPPPSDQEVAKGLAGKDFECQMIIGHHSGNYYIKEYRVNQGHEPNWSVSTMFELGMRYKPFKLVISAIAYEKTLKWIFEQEMKRRGMYYPIELVTDRRPKFNRIVSTLSGLAANGKLFCKPEHADLLSQFADYPQVAHDDIVDALATGISRLANPVLEMGGEEYLKVQMAGGSYKVPRLGGHP